MIKRCWHFTFFIIVVSQSVIADNNDVQALILQNMPEYSVIESEKGEINSNSYIAALVSSQTKNDIGLVVFKKTSSNNYQLVSKTKFWMLHERHMWSASIEKNSIFLSVSGSGGCCSRYYLSYQFKNIGEKFKLVGVETLEFGFTSQQDSNDVAIDGKYLSYEYGKSINLLTKKVIHWRKQGKSLEKDPYQVIGKTRKVEKYSNFLDSYNLDIENFDYWDFDEYMTNTNGIKGYIDESFKYNQ